MVEGLLVGEIVMNRIGIMKFNDLTNNLYAEVDFDTMHEKSIGSRIGGALKFWGSTPEKVLKDQFKVSIYQTTSKDVGERVLISEGGGSWLEYLEFDNEKYWEMKRIKDMTDDDP